MVKDDFCFEFGLEAKSGFMSRLEEGLWVRESCGFMVLRPCFGLLKGSQKASGSGASCWGCGGLAPRYWPRDEVQLRHICMNQRWSSISLDLRGAQMVQWSPSPEAAMAAAAMEC